MKKIIVTGIDTEVGKTLVAAILTVIFQADYWKPVECGPSDNKDSSVIRRLLDKSKHRIFPPKYSLPHSLSPHESGQLSGTLIEASKITPPSHKRVLIIEGIGGLLSPIDDTSNNLDLFSQWPALWVVVSKHYLGSINHTLLTLEALKNKNISVSALIFNGHNPYSESFIKNKTSVLTVARLNQENIIDKTTVLRYANQWQHLYMLL